MNDLSQVKYNLENLPGIEIQQFCGISWQSEKDPNLTYTDGNPAVGELTADLGDGTLVPIPVCESCLELVSRNVTNNFSIKE